MTTSVITRVQEILNSDESLKLLYDPPIDGPREGQFHSLEKSSLHQNVLDYLKEQFPDGLYTHQHEAIEVYINYDEGIVI